jgi:hypothetical protein
MANNGHDLGEVHRLTSQRGGSVVSDVGAHTHAVLDGAWGIGPDATLPTVAIRATRNIDKSAVDALRANAIDSLGCADR